MLALYEAWGRPIYVREFAVAHASELALGYVESSRPLRGKARRIDVCAGYGVVCGSLSAWMARGGWNFQSAASPRIAQLSYIMGSAIPFLLSFFCSVEGSDDEGCSEGIWTKDRRR